MKFSKKEHKVFLNLCRLKQNGILGLMRATLTEKYGAKNVIATPRYIMAKGSIPVALVAHADTVFTLPPEEFFFDEEKNVIWSPDGLGADDRAGIYAILHIMKLGYRPHIIITTDEESGCIGASKLVGAYHTFPWDLKFMIQLDRRGKNDCVFYDCDNPDFEKFIEGFGFVTAWGSLSDISVLAPVWGIAATNLSVGYKEEHSTKEHLYVSALLDTIEKTSHILDYVQKHPILEPFKYIPATPSYGFLSHRYNNLWDTEDWWEHPTAGECRCYLCTAIDYMTNMIPVHTDENNMYYICNECFAAHYDSLEWCSECGEAWTVTPEETEELKTIPRAEWKCRCCKKKGTAG